MQTVAEKCCYLERRGVMLRGNEPGEAMRRALTSPEARDMLLCPSSIAPVPPYARVMGSGVAAKLVCVLN